MDVRTFLGQKATPVTVGSFVDRMWNRNSKLCIFTPILLCNFYSTHIILKYGRRARDGDPRINDFGGLLWI